MLIKFTKTGPVLVREGGQSKEKANRFVDKHGFNAKFMDEYGSFMIESTPGKPYEDLARDLVKVEKNMIIRRRIIERMLGPDEHVT
eukprot:UN06139